MASSHLASKKYSIAAFNVAKRSSLIDQFESDLAKFSLSLPASAIKELSNPTIRRQALGEIITAIGEKLSLHKKVNEFLVVVASARRISQILEIKEEFSKLVKKEKNIIEVSIISATDLDEKNVDEIEKIVANKNQNKSILIKRTIDKNILGGVQIKIGGTIIDASLKTQLSKLKTEFISTL
ncbi:MAG: F-type H+-transporting ATPase subunit delta [Lentimonas sp.]|jgi:F-type H+-transporting ATPase subunit delta